jgi:hypothetical protein
MFIMALSEYDQRLYEDETVNRMHESLALFTQMLSIPFFKSTSFILFFNKQVLKGQSGPLHSDALHSLLQVYLLHTVL